MGKSHSWAFVGKVLAFIAFVAIVAMLMSSCNPVKRITRIAANHPGALAGPCAQFYPVRVIDSTRIEVIDGGTVYQYDTVTVDCDSVMQAYHVPGSGNKVNTKYVRVPCPPSSHRVDTILTERFRQVENTARVEVLTQDLNKANATIASKSSTNKMLWWALGLLGAYTILRLVLRMYTRISLP